MSREKGGDFLKENTTRLDIKKSIMNRRGGATEWLLPLFITKIKY